MKYKPIKLKDGLYYLCKTKPELATEPGLTTEEKVIIELSEMLEKNNIAFHDVEEFYKDEI